MTTHLEIISSNGALRIDSRVLAIQLGYEHKIILQSIRRHKIRLEARSALLHFKAVLKHEGCQDSSRQIYSLLDERQCLILSGSLKKDKEADEWHDRLVDDFLQARERARQLENQPSQQAPQPPINSLWEKHALLFNQHTRIPAGYWCVFNEIAQVCWGMEFRGEHLQEDAVPNISIGYLWMKEIRRSGLDERCIRQYRYHYPDRRGVQYANIYSNAWLGLFRDWFERKYLKYEFHHYVQRHARLLVPSSATKQLHEEG